MSNNRADLVPEQRVDKNGRVVTRHVKRDATKATPALPVPKIDNLISDTEQVALQIFKMVGEVYRIDPNGRKEPLTLSPHYSKQLLNKVHNREHIIRVHDLFTAALENGLEKAYEAMNAIIYTMFDVEDVSVAHAHQEEFLKSPYDLAAMTMLCKSLEAHGITPDPDTQRIETILAHMKAYTHYEDCVIERFVEWNEHKYWSMENAAYVRGVEDNADHIEELLEYRNSTGASYKDKFDQSDFNNYMEHGALKSGWL